MSSRVQAFLKGIRAAGLGLSTVALTISLSSCTAPPPTTYESVIGLTVLEATPLLPDDLRIYDLSIPLLDIAPAYNGSEPAGRWVIVAQCPEIDAGQSALFPLTSTRVTSEQPPKITGGTTRYWSALNR